MNTLIYFTVLIFVPLKLFNARVFREILAWLFTVLLPKVPLWFIPILFSFFFVRNQQSECEKER